MGYRRVVMDTVEAQDALLHILMIFICFLLSS